jgi:anti-sigma factor (TIGR02949 family)
MDCREYRWQIQASLHGELSDEAELELERHLADCAGCRHERDFEHRFFQRLREIPRPMAPERLRSRVESQLRASQPSVLWRPRTWSLAGALAAAMLIVGLVLFPFGSAASEIDGTIVCIACTLRPETAHLHAERRALDHVNGLQDHAGRIWHLLDSEAFHDLRVDDALLGRKVTVRGTLFPEARAIEPLSIKNDVARLESGEAGQTPPCPASGAHSEVARIGVAGIKLL